MKICMERLMAIIKYAATLFLWIAVFAYLHHFLLGDQQARANSLSMFLFLIIAVLAIFILCWRQYNFHRFGKLGRRKSVSQATIGQIGKAFSLDVDAVERLRDAPRLNLSIKKEPDGGSGAPGQIMVISGEGCEYEISPPKFAQESGWYPGAARTCGGNSGGAG